MTVASPCIRLCILDQRTSLCLGCWRSLDEIAAWSSFDDERRRLIVAALPARRSAAAPGADGAAEPAIPAGR